MPKALIPAAAIDLGSNSFRLLIGLQDEQELVIIARERTTIRLAQGLGANGLITTAKLATALAAITSFRREMDRFAVGRVRCCGTEALRRATNRHSFLDPAGIILGTPIEVLTGREEADLCRLAVQDNLADRISFPCLIADVGGGSSEFIFQSSPQCPARVISLPLGAVTLAELETVAKETALRCLSGEVKNFLKEIDQPMIKTMVGSGGTATSLAMMAQQLSAYNSSRINGFFLSRTKINALQGSLAGLSVKQRKDLPGLEAERADIISSGLEIYQEILATIGATGMIVSDAGLLEGILCSITRGALT